MTSERNARSLKIADSLWSVLEIMSREMGTDRDNLVNQAIYQWARTNGFVDPPRTTLNDTYDDSVRPPRAGPGPTDISDLKADSDGSNSAALPPGSGAFPRSMSVVFDGTVARGLPNSSSTRRAEGTVARAIDAIAPHEMGDRLPSQEVPSNVSSAARRPPSAEPFPRSGTAPMAHAPEKLSTPPSQASNSGSRASRTRTSSGGEGARTSLGGVPSQELLRMRAQQVLRIASIMEDAERFLLPSPGSKLEFEPEESVSRSAANLPVPISSIPETANEASSSKRFDAPRSGSTVQATPARHIFLVLANGERVEVDAPRFVVGRSPECNLVLASTRVSREHIAIVREGPHIFLEDLGSSNGTWLGEQRVTRDLLQNGDEFTLGDQKIRLEMTA